VRVADPRDFREQISRAKLRHVWISGNVRHRGDFDVDFIASFRLFLREVLRGRRGKLFAQKRRGAGCHRKHDWRIQTCVCVMYIYIYINAGVLLEFDERGKKSGVCVSFCAFLRRQTFS